MQRDMILGIDVGSVAASMAVVDRDGGVVATDYRFHRGEVGATVVKLIGAVDLTRIAEVVATASTPAGVVAGRRYNNDLATIATAKRFHPQMRGLLLVGGERFSLAAFDHDGRYLGSRTNTSCAAGTGSFLDQQAVRLNLESSARLSAIAGASRGPVPKIASRCAVFAKTDLIHAQQEGHTLETISDGLCQGLAKNIVDTLFVEGRAPEGEIVFCGGVARNEAVVRHIENLISARLTLPELGHLYGALGACFMALDVVMAGSGAVAAEGPCSIEQVVKPRQEAIREYHFPPLSLQLSDYPEFTSVESYLDQPAGQQAVEVDIYRALPAGSPLPVYLGIDIGSTSTKAVLLAEDREVLVGLYTRTAGRPLAAVQALLRAMHAIECDKGLSFEVIQCGTTGSGRKFIGRIVGADQMIDEITAHARAAFELNPAVDTIIEIGGQDAKFTTLQQGRVTSSTMNTVCAAGTGSFIEEQAAKLGCRVQDYARRAENQQAPMVSDRCTVFMERDMNHYLSEGYRVDEVLASALHAVRENYLQKVACEHHIGRVVLFQGATAKNRALVAAFEQRLERPILVSKFCHLTGALGTALLLQDEGATASSFRGVGFYRQPVTISGEVCEFCTNHCKISVAEIEGGKVAYGFLCGRDYETKRHVAEDSGAFDLVRTWRRTHRPTRSADTGGPSIGLPAAVHMVEDLPMWQQFFAELGITTISSEQYSDGLKAGKNLTGAEFCAPMTAMHGHVAWLLGQADYVFLPTYLEEKDPDARRQYCYYTQFLPALAGGCEERVLRPVLRYLYTPFHARIQLYRMLQKILPGRCSFFAVSQAYERALQYRQERRRQLLALMDERTTDRDDIQVVLLGRPYTVFGPGMNGKIPELFRRLGVDAFYQDMLRYDTSEVEGIKPLLNELHWEHAARILGAAEVIGSRANLYPVFLTSFMCTPDAFTLEYFKQVMEGHQKPYLILQLDEHDSSVGYETRIEAAVRSFRNHRQQRRLKAPMVDYRGINPCLESGLDRKYVIFPNWDRITCELLAASLRREGYTVVLIEESRRTIREALRHNSGQCIPLNGVAQGYIDTIRRLGLAPEECTLWLNHSTLACNIRLYPHHIKTILAGQGLGAAGVYVGQLSFADISLRAAGNAYFAYMLGGMLRKIACRIRPYERQTGETDRVLDKSVELLSAAFSRGTEKEEALREIVTRFAWIEKELVDRPKIAIFGDIYVRDNRVMNQDLVRFIEAHGGEVITTPYSEYAKMVAPSYFRKWFNEGKYFDLFAYRALLVTMGHAEKNYLRILGRVLDEPEHPYDDDPADILAKYHIQPENTGESMDNILKIHYIRKYHPEISLFVQTSPALCCPSLVTEAMRERIEAVTGVPVVSVTYDGTGGEKNEVILPYLRYPRQTAVDQSPTGWPRQRLG